MIRTTARATGHWLTTHTRRGTRAWRTGWWLTHRAGGQPTSRY